MTRNVTIKTWYVVSGTAGATVKSEDGTVTFCTIPEGGQGYFYSTADKVVTSDDSVKITEATFNRAALALRLLGGGVVDYDAKYADCVTVADMAAVDANYMADLNAQRVKVLPSLVSGSFDGLKVSPPYMPKRSNYTSAFLNFLGEEIFLDIPQVVDGNKFWEVISSSTLRVFKGRLPKLKVATYTFRLCPNLQYFEVEELPELTISADVYSSMFEQTKLKEFHTACPKLYKAYHVKGMFDGLITLAVCSVGFPALQIANRMFYGCILDKKSACTVLNSLQQSTGAVTNPESWTITIGIHVDHQADEEVIAAITGAEEKGWTVTVQWNGTATAAASVSTYGLRRRKPVYAKLGEPLEDGTLRLDWGHYVTDPSGYTEFASLEEAKEYFGVTE